MSNTVFFKNVNIFKIDSKTKITSNHTIDGLASLTSDLFWKFLKAIKYRLNCGFMWTFIFNST